MALSKLNNDSFADTAVHGQRNLIINGAMQIFQRSTSLSVTDGTNEDYATADRFNFRFGNSAGGAATLSQSTDAPSGYGFSNSWKFDVTTSASSYTSGQHTLFAQFIEAQNIRNSGWDYTNPNSYVTLSFWVKSNKTGTYCISINTPDVSGDLKFIKEWTISSSSTWEHKVIKIPGHASLVIDNDNGRGFEVEWNLATASDRDNATDDTWWTTDGSRTTSNQVNFFDSTSNELYITGVQLEVGDKATPFEHRSYGDELARCQRYYHILKRGPSDSATPIASGLNVGSQARGICPFPVSMRANPSVGYSSLSDIKVYSSGGNQSPTAIANGGTNTTRSMMRLTANFTNGSTGDGILIQINGTSGSDYIDFDAEL